MEEEHRSSRLQAWLLGRSFDLALQANKDLPPTRKEHNRKKPDWVKIEKQRADAEEFLQAYRYHYGHPYLYEKFMGLIPLFDEPEEAAAPDMVVVTKEQREERSRQLRAMEARLVEDMYKIREVHGNIDLTKMQPT